MSDATPKSIVQQQFGANAAAYATSAVHAKGASLARLVELVGPHKDWAVLDVATGAGHTAAAFAPHVARVVASDLTPQMLDQAAKLAREKGYANMTTASADAEKLPFPDKSFDVVTCRIAPHHFPNIPAFLAESLRVLKPGGTFALVDNVSPDEIVTPGHSAAALGEAAAAYNTFEKVRDPSHGRALTTAEWIADVKAAGFALEHTEHAPKAMDFDGWCKNMSVPGNLVPQLRAMLENAAPALAAFLQPRNEGGKLGFTLCELILIARRPS